MRQKGIALIVILLAFVLLGILSYTAYLRGYLNLNIPQKTITDSTPYPIETPQATPGRTGEWKTFRNDELGFEFKYPNSWQVILSSSTSLIISNKYFDPSLDVMTPLSNQVFLNFGLNHASLENYSPVKREYSSTEGVEVIEQGRYIDDNGSFGIVSLYRADDNGKLEHEKIIDQIVSSLKFTK